MEAIIKAAVSNKQILTFYSPYNFIREFPADKQFENYVLNKIAAFDKNANNKIITVEIEHASFYFLLSYLPWDTDFFKIHTYKLLHVLSENEDIHLLRAACKEFIKRINDETFYCFIDIPSEDIRLIQALNDAGFCLIETRLHYYRNLEGFSGPRYNVREARAEDIPALMQTAADTRNNYDRFHADYVFDADTADRFLAKYIEECVKGYTDIVLVPNEPGLEVRSFMSANYHKDEWEKNGVAISKPVVSAVAPENKGWYKKFASEISHYSREAGAQYMILNTQTTNRAVFHTWESLGYKLGCATHILRYTNK